MFIIGHGSVPEEFHEVLDLRLPLHVGVGLISWSPEIETDSIRDQTRRNAVSKGRRKRGDRGQRKAWQSYQI